MAERSQVAAWDFFGLDAEAFPGDSLLQREWEEPVVPAGQEPRGYPALTPMKFHRTGEAATVGHLRGNRRGTGQAGIFTPVRSASAVSSSSWNRCERAAGCSSRGRWW